MTNETDFTNFKGRLALFINRSGLSKKEFAERCGIKETQLYSYLKGASEPNTKVLRNIKKEFPDICIDWLISGEGEPYFERAAELPGTVVDLQHDRVIRQFDDKQFALEINQALVMLEKVSAREFYKIGGYIKAKVEQAGQSETEDVALEATNNAPKN